MALPDSLLYKIALALTFRHFGASAFNVEFQ